MGEDRENADVAAIKIDADGAWTLALADLTAARIWDRQSGALTGKGDDVVLVGPPTSGLYVVAVKNTGDENFIIWAYSPAGRDLSVNEIGPYSGEAILPDGTVLLQIRAVGGWSITPE